MRPMATLFAVVLGITLGGFSLDLSRPHSLIAKSAMPDPGLTDAPSEGTCFTCHNGGLNDPYGIIQIFNAPPVYTPGQDYLLVAVIVRTFGGSRWGFEATALTSGGLMAGTLGDSSASVGTQTQGGKTYVSQTTLEGFDGTFSSASDSIGAAWAFKWTAPPVGTGPVTFYAAGTACDKDNSANAGDYTYTTSVTSNEGSATDVKATTWGEIKRIYR